MKKILLLLHTFAFGQFMFADYNPEIINNYNDIRLIDAISVLQKYETKPNAKINFSSFSFFKNSDCKETHYSLIFNFSGNVTLSEVKIFSAMINNLMLENLNNSSNKENTAPEDTDQSNLESNQEEKD